jgi:hypothetical protein
MDAAPRISPVVVDLTAEQVASDTPHVLVPAKTVQMLVADEHVVDILNLERKMIEPRPIIPYAEEGLVIDIIIASIDSAKLTDDVVLVPSINIVRADQTKCFAKQRTVS